MNRITITDVEFYSQLRSQIGSFGRLQDCSHKAEELYAFLSSHREFVQSTDGLEKLYEPFISHFDHSVFLAKETENVIDSRFKVKDRKKLISLRVLLTTIVRQLSSAEVLLLRGFPDTPTVFLVSSVKCNEA